MPGPESYRDLLLRPFVAGVIDTAMPVVVIVVLGILAGLLLGIRKRRARKGDD